MYRKLLSRIVIIATLGLTVVLGLTRMLRSDVVASPAAQVVPAPSANPFYKFDVIAKTNEPILKLKTIGTGVSINDNGKVAFVGETSAGEGVYVGGVYVQGELVPPIHMNPNLTAPNRFYDPAVQINNADQVVAVDRQINSDHLTVISYDLWRFDLSHTAGLADRIDTGGPAFSQFKAIHKYPSINNLGQVVFDADEEVMIGTTKTIITKMLTPKLSGPGYYAVEIPTPLWPVISDNGHFVIRAGTLLGSIDPLRLYFYNQGNAFLDIACSPGAVCEHPGFPYNAKSKGLGNKPGVSDDGKIVAFYGTLDAALAATLGTTSGPGIFASINEGGGGNRKLIRIAGGSWDDIGLQCLQPELGSDATAKPICFKSFDSDSRVAVARLDSGAPGISDDRFVVSFIATPNAASPINHFSAMKGLWTIRVDAQQVTDGWQYRLAPPVPVAQIGNVISGRTLTDLAVHDPIANTATDDLGAPRIPRSGEHRIAFWASTIENGMLGQMVVRASQSRLTVDTVNSTLDGDSSSVNALLGNRGSDGKISLPEAIAAVNNTGPGYTINFSLTVGSAIVITSTLTLTASNTVIDGEMNGNGQPDVVVDAPIGLPSLIIRSDGNIVQYLAITGLVLDGAGANNNRIIGCYIGPAFADEKKNIDGITIKNDAHSNIINDNIIVGNSFMDDRIASGIRIDSGAYLNEIRGNYIGVNEQGNPVPNETGITITGKAHYNIIGGDRGMQRMCDSPCNVISGNILDGIHLQGSETSDNVVWGNFIGVHPTGTVPRPNNLNGIAVSNGASNNLIGHDIRTSRWCTNRCNIISGNRWAGVSLMGGGTTDTRTTGNRVEGNYIGVPLDSSQGQELHNGTSGVVIGNGAQENQVGGVDLLNQCTGACNVISGNHEDGVLLRNTGTMSNTIQGNYIGLNATGAYSVANKHSGITVIEEASRNIIGGKILSSPALVQCSGGCNVISGNTMAGVMLQDAGTNLNVVKGNYIGIRPDGTTPLPNTGPGIVVQRGASENTIGGKRPSVKCDGPCNLISGNALEGIVLSGNGTTRNMVQGNYIGIDATGTITLPNKLGGVVVQRGASQNHIGGDRGTSVTCIGFCNVVSGNAQAGIVIASSDTMSNTVQGNYVGVRPDGTVSLPNEGSGVLVQTGASENTIGGKRLSVVCDGPCNVISGNRQSGIALVGGGSRNIVQGNYIGLNLQGMVAIPNGAQGVYVSGGTDNPLDVKAAYALEAGLNQTSWPKPGEFESYDAVLRVYEKLKEYNGEAVREEGLLNNGSGILFEMMFNDEKTWTRSPAPNTPKWDSEDGDKKLWQIKSYPEIECSEVIKILSEPNPAPLDVWGLALPKGTDIGDCDSVNGVQLDLRKKQGRIVWSDQITAADVRNRILDFFAYARNIIPGSPPPSAALTTLNIIGGDRGLDVRVCEGPCNVISGNKELGVLLDGAGASGNLVEGNYIGLNSQGTAAIPNLWEGVGVLDAPQNIIGGERAFIVCTGPCNIISGNRGGGVVLWGVGSMGNVVKGNHIGLGATGVFSVPNGMAGVTVKFGASKSIVGGERNSIECNGPCNVISGNGTHGVLASETTTNTVQGNYIGTNPEGTKPIPNSSYGVALGNGASHNIIGAAQDAPISGLCVGLCNLIRSNRKGGVAVTGATSSGNTIRGNQLYDNGGLAIDLGNNEHTYNDTGDIDGGPNDWMNFPRRLTAQSDGATTTIKGSLDTLNPEAVQVDIYVSDQPDPTYSTKAPVYLGSTTPDSSGAFALSLNGELPAPFLTAIATDGNGSTSEFFGRAPVVFIPGMAGSELVDLADGTELWPGDLTTNHLRLSLFPTDHPFKTLPNIVATDALRCVKALGVCAKVIYRSVLQKLVNEGYTEYKVNRDPLLRSEAGCDDLNQKKDHPTLFVYAYDWRKSYIENAKNLKGYIECIHKFYPNTKVDIVAHSMGGLLARSYILQFPDDHSVGALITMGSPFLGAPKALYTMETGWMGGLLEAIFVFPETGKAIARSSPGIYQALPAEAYYTFAGGTPATSPWEGHSYESYIRTLNERYIPPKGMPGPGTVVAAFHAGMQDNWSADAKGVKYYHIYSALGETTVGQLPHDISRVVPVLQLVCEPNSLLCSTVLKLQPKFADGDETAPLLSAKRWEDALGLNYNAKDALLLPVSGVEHVAMPGDPKVQNLLLDILARTTPSQAIPALAGPAEEAIRSIDADSTTATDRQLAAPLPVRQPYYVTINGSDDVVVRDAVGHSTAPIGGILQEEVPGVNIYPVGNNLQMVILGPDGTYRITFRTIGQPLAIELTKGTGDAVTQAIRYQDLTLPISVTALITLTAGNVGILRYDGDGDGVFETIVTPTVAVSGPQALDMEAPTITVSNTVQLSTTMATLTAQDSGSGVRALFYSLDGTHFQPYTSTLQLKPALTPILYAFADDNLANRGVQIFPMETVSPTVRIDSPTAEIFINVGSSLTVTLTVSDNIKVDAVAVAFDVDGDGRADGTGETIATTITDTEAFTATFANIAGPSGPRIIYASASDPSGNSGTITKVVNITSQATLTPTDTPTPTSTVISTNTPTSTPTVTTTSTRTPIDTITPTSTPTSTPTATDISTSTNTPTPTNTPTRAATTTPTRTSSPTTKPIRTRTPTVTPTPTTAAVLVRWVGTTSGSWHDPANWSTGATPGPFADVLIEASSAITVTHSQNSDTIHSLHSQAALKITGGSLIIATESEVSSNFTLSGGTLAGSGNLTVNGWLAWTGGTMSGSGHTIINRAAAISGLSAKTLSGRTLDNSGTMTWRGGAINADSGAIFNNLPGASFDLQGDLAFAGSAGEIFNNAGTFRKSVGTGTAKLSIAFNNNGAVEIQAGTLRLAAGGSSRGRFTGAADTTLEFATNPAYTLAKDALVRFPNVLFSSGTVNIYGVYDVTEGTRMFGTANFNPGATIVNVGNTLTINNNSKANFNTGLPITTTNLIMLGGELTGASDVTANEYLDWAGGKLSGSGHTIINLEATISGANSKTLSGRILDNTGTTTWTGGVITVDSGGVFNNQPGALFELQGELVFSESTTGTFNNLGTFRKSAGAGTATIGLVFNNNGWVDIQMGTLRLGTASVSHGQFTGAVGTTLELAAYQPYVLERDSLIRVPHVVFAGRANLYGTYDVSESTSFLRGPGAADINFNPEAVIVSLGHTLIINDSSKVNFSSSTPITVTTLILERGDLTGVNDLTVTGVLTWSGGTMSGSGKTISTGQLVIKQGNGYLSLARTVENRGLATWSGGAIYPDSAGIFNNLPGALFDLQGDLSFAPVGGTFNNAGTFRKSAGTGTANMGLVVFNNNGWVDIQVGTLRFGERGVSRGQFTGAAGTTLEFTSYQPYVLERDSLIRVPNVTFAGRANLSGTYDVSESTSFLPGAADVNFNPQAVIVNVGNTLTINSNGKANFNTGLPITTTNLIMIGVNGSELTGASDVIVTGILTWSGGTMSGSGKTISTGQLVMKQGINRRTLARTMENHGLATWSAGDMYADSGGIFNNLSGASFDLQGDVAFSNAGPISGIFNNAGTFRKSAGVGIAKIGLVFNNNGWVDIQVGTLRFGERGVSHGQFTGAAGTTLELASYQPYILERDSLIRVPNVVFAGRANLSGTYDASESTSFLPGAADVNFNSQAVIVNVGHTLTINSNGKANFNTGLPITTTNLIMIGVNGSELTGASDVIVTGTLTWSGGKMSGSGKTISTGQLVMKQGINRRTLARTLENHGLATWSAGHISAESGGVLLNAMGATFDITGNGLFFWCDPGTGSCQFLEPQPTFINAGRVIKSGGGVTKFSNPGNLAGPVTFNNRAVVEVVTGTLDLGEQGGGYRQSAGTLSLQGGNIIVTGAMLDIQGGSLSGTGIITGPISNAGEVNPGGAGVAGRLTIKGNYTQAKNGSLNIDLGGLSPGAQYDQLNITGLAMLNGQLVIHLINGYLPNHGDAFSVANYNSRTGTFATINGLSLGAGRSLVPGYNSTNFSLVTVNTGLPK